MTDSTLDQRCDCGQSLGATGDHTKRLHTYGRPPATPRWLTWTRENQSRGKSLDSGRAA